MTQARISPSGPRLSTGQRYPWATDQVGTAAEQTDNIVIGSVTPITDYAGNGANKQGGSIQRILHDGFLQNGTVAFWRMKSSVTNALGDYAVVMRLGEHWQTTEDATAMLPEVARLIIPGSSPQWPGPYPHPDAERIFSDWLDPNGDPIQQIKVTKDQVVICTMDTPETPDGRSSQQLTVDWTLTG